MEIWVEMVVLNGVIAVVYSATRGEAVREIVVGAARMFLITGLVVGTLILATSLFAG